MGGCTPFRSLLRGALRATLKATSNVVCGALRRRELAGGRSQREVRKKFADFIRPRSLDQPWRPPRPRSTRAPPEDRIPDPAHVAFRLSPKAHRHVVRFQFLVARPPTASCNSSLNQVSWKNVPWSQRRHGGLQEERIAGSALLLFFLQTRLTAGTRYDPACSTVAISNRRAKWPRIKY
jgi:hypothetical protein